MRRTIKNLLRDLNTNTAEGMTASRLPMLQSGSFDFLVTDWNMPGMTVPTCCAPACEDDRQRMLVLDGHGRSRDQIIESALTVM
jgi:two-component system chemotaxis response regulator CheY